jgi:hypothetical protein
MLRGILSVILLWPMLLWAQPMALRYQLGDDSSAVANTLDIVPLGGEGGDVAPKTYWMVGLPFPGDVLWRPATQQLAYRHPAESSWLLATPALLPPANTSSLPGALGPAAQGQPTRRWVQQVAGHDCGPLFGSQTLGARYGLNIADFQALYRLLYWLNAAQLPPGCANAQTQPSSARQLGLPTRWASPMGMLVWQGAVMLPTVSNPPSWPRLTYPPTPEVQLRLLLAQLPVPLRADFIRENATLPLNQQVEKLAGMLANQARVEN